MILVDELCEALVLFQERQQKTGLVLGGLSQYAEDGADGCDAENRVDQNTNALLGCGVAIKQREKRCECE